MGLVRFSNTSCDENVVCGPSPVLPASFIEWLLSISNVLWDLCLDDALEIHGIVTQMQIGLKYCYLSTAVKDGSNKTEFNGTLQNQIPPNGSVISYMVSFSL